MYIQFSAKVICIFYWIFINWKWVVFNVWSNRFGYMLYKCLFKSNQHENTQLSACLCSWKCWIYKLFG